MKIFFHITNTKWHCFLQELIWICNFWIIFRSIWKSWTHKIKCYQICRSETFKIYYSLFIILNIKHYASLMKHPKTINSWWADFHWQTSQIKLKQQNDELTSFSLSVQTLTCLNVPQLFSQLRVQQSPSMSPVRCCITAPSLWFYLQTSELRGQRSHLQQHL